MTKKSVGQPLPIGVETRSAPASLAATHRGFTFYVARPTRSIHSCQFVVKLELCAIRNVDPTLAFGWLQTGGALAVIQPFRENLFARVFEVTLLECRFALLIFRPIGLLAFVHQA